LQGEVVGGSFQRTGKTAKNLTRMNTENHREEHRKTTRKNTNDGMNPETYEFTFYWNCATAD
jgi:hypothetical protein